MLSDIYDVTIIGAGVIGAAIARKLSAYNLKTVIVEKECDVSFGVSKANSGIIHGGFHHDSSTLKARLEIKGNIMFDQLKEELYFPFNRCGIVVAAFNDDEMRTVEKLYENGINNKAIGIELCNRERIQYLEPKLNSDVIGGLFAPSGGIIEPYRFVFSLIESAQKNGVDLLTNFKVQNGKHNGEYYTIEAEDGRSIESKWVINAAGLYCDEISQIFGAEEYNSKGMLVIPTVEGTTMIGPTALIVDDKEDRNTSKENFNKVFNSARRLVPTVSERDVISSFAGLRPALEGNDFYIEMSKKTPKFVQVAGIQSPGLTASPAIAEYVKDLLKKTGLKLVEKADYDPYIEKVERFRNNSKNEIDQLIKENPAYGEIICRCENISEAEVVAAVRKGHNSLDGIKFYTRAMMGRCQGGFCTYKILKIIARETGCSVDEISKRGGKSWIVNKAVGDFPVEIKQ
ncbi:MAG: FAD/NAD(P)-binding oxidoreductase [Spirochaetaceae bacterium 4572_7]|nr:MAG: FAD/NAD(P)-binding oxidoreductase [Spirochaetaceae bacterium 4572_7]